MGLLARLMGRSRGQTTGNGEAGTDPGRPGGIPLRAVEVSAVPKRSRQEIMEELERNYNEVVDLVRRMKSHMEREDERAERLLAVAERVETSLVPATERLPGLLERMERSGQETGERLQETVNGISASLGEASEAQLRLAEGVESVASSSARAGEALDSMNRREQEIAEAVGSVRRTLLAATIASVCVAVIAVAIAVFALLRTTGQAG